MSMVKASAFGRLSTKDIGIAIRDFLEDQAVEIIDWEDQDGDGGTDRFVKVVSVDVSDANNPLVTLDNGQRFRVRIFAEG